MRGFRYCLMVAVCWRARTFPNAAKVCRGVSGSMGFFDQALKIPLDQPHNIADILFLAV